VKLSPWILGLSAGLMSTAVSATGHHSVSAEFDTNQPITFSGTVVRVDWMNPHIYTLVEVESEDGSSVTYRVEGSAPNSLYRRGWRKDSLQPGDTVVVEGIRAKNPESPNVGSATITDSEGRQVFSGNNR
jgi:hypothetical protein